MKTPQPIVIDTERRTVELGGKQIIVAPKEFDVLACLAQAEEKVVTRETLLSEIWGDAEDFVDNRLVDQQIARLRKKIGWDYIITATCAGYRLVNARINTARERWGRVKTVDRTFGKTPRAVVTLEVIGSALETVSAGHKVRVV